MSTGAAPNTAKAETDINPHVINIEAWTTFVRGLVKRANNTSRSFREAIVAESEIFATLEAYSSDKLRIIRSGEFAACDGAFVLNPEALEDIPPVGTDYLDMMRWAGQSSGVKFLTFDFKSVVFRPLNNNLHQRSGKHDVAYKWTDTAGKEEADVIIVSVQGVEDAFAIMPSEVWEVAREFGYGIEPLMHKVPPYMQIFMVHFDDLGGAVNSLLRAAVTGGREPFCNPSTGVVIDGWSPRTVEGIRDMLASEQIGTSEASILRLKDAISSTGPGNVLYANVMQPLICDFLLQLNGYNQLFFVEHKRRPWYTKHPFTTNTMQVPIFSPNRVWHFVMIEHNGAKKMPFPESQPTGSQFPATLCIPRDAIRDFWQTSPELVTWEEVSEFACYNVEAILRVVESRATGAIGAAAEAMSRLSEAGEEAILSTNAIDRLNVMAARREEGYKRPIKSAASAKGTEFFLKNLPWLSADLNRVCAKHRYGLVFVLPIGHCNNSHVLVDYVWKESDSLEEGLPLLISDPRLRDAKVLPLAFVDTKPHMSGMHDAAWPLNMSRNDWQRRGVQQDFVYVGSYMNSAYMEAPSTNKDYWIFSSEFTTQLSQGLKAKIASQDKPGNFFARNSIDDDLLPNPRLEQNRRPTAITRGSGFLAQEFKHVDPARYILNGQEQLYRSLCSLLKGSRAVHIGSPHSLTPNAPFTVERHHTTLREVLQATWDFGSEFPYTMIV
jgi:hypothetical protein